MEILSTILLPLVKVFEVISKLMSKILGSKEESELSEEELKTIVTMGAEEGILNKEAAEMMHNILEFKGTKVTEIMTPDVDIEMIDGNKQLKDVVDFVVKTPYSKYPVYLESRDKVVGILDVDDVLKYMKNKKLNVKVKSIAREVFFVPQSKEIDDLLSELERKKMSIAIVVDEYGDVSGLVAVEDILEEIVGNIFDKSQRQSVLIKKVSNKLIRIDARATVEEINKILHLGLKGENFNTIAGFVEHKLQKIPRKATPRGCGYSKSPTRTETGAFPRTNGLRPATSTSSSSASPPIPIPSPSPSICAASTSPSRCTSATCEARSSAMPWPGSFNGAAARFTGRTTSATGA